MRTLVIQLARFGDIYQTWPTLRALHRHAADAEVHLLVRERFAAATEGLENTVVHVWPTQTIIEPAVLNEDDAGSVERLNEVVQHLKNLNFERIVNLTFSPMSSFLTDMLAGAETEVRGYTRSSDGHLCIPDDTSAYFYAQVGIGRGNRHHVNDLFAAIAGVELQNCDYETPVLTRRERSGILVHIGASQTEKVYPAERWVQVLKALRAQTDEPIELIGSREERPVSETVAEQADIENCTNRVGQTQLFELMARVGQAQLVMGADSAPMHMAGLVGTPALNLSSNTVNFFETGPRAPGSRVLYAPSLLDIQPQAIVLEALGILQSRAMQMTGAECLGSIEPYRLSNWQIESFPWKLILALYSEQPYPPLETQADRLAMQRLFELAELAISQLQAWPAKGAPPKRALWVLSQVDELLPEVVKLNFRLEPIVQWFQTERIRLAPGEVHHVRQRTLQLFQNLLTVTSVYMNRGDQNPLDWGLAIRLAEQCALQMREFKMSKVENEFFELMSVLHEIASHQTKVAGEAWTSVLMELEQAMKANDLIAAADILEWRLVPALSHAQSEGETMSSAVIS